MTNYANNLHREIDMYINWLDMFKATSDVKIVQKAFEQDDYGRDGGNIIRFLVNLHSKEFLTEAHKINKKKEK